jgi:regulator of protease activity HflC (stomatin/prohibitin superfamily)
MLFKDEIVYVFETHRGLWFEDGAYKKLLEPGRYEVPKHFDLPFYKKPKIIVKQVDMRERDLTIKGQEILTSDKVAIRVSIIVQFKVSDPKAAFLNVEKYEDRLYSDVQLAARRSLANMSLEAILTNRNSLSEDILNEVKPIALRYGVEIMRADVKDLIFPGDVQEIMNRVLKAERISQAQMVEAKSRAEIEILDSKTKSEQSVIETDAQAKIYTITAETDARTSGIKAEADAKAMNIKTGAEIQATKAKAEAEKELIRNKEELAKLFSSYPHLVKIEQIKAMEAIMRNSNAKVYMGLDKLMLDKIEEK